MQVAPAHQLVGQHIGSCYVEQLLARGRLTAVYRAQQPVHRRHVAITTFIIPEQLSTEARNRFVTRFMNEGATLVTLKHPHILPIYEYGEQMGCPYLMTPYVTEGSLADILNQQGRCTAETALVIMEQIAAALEYAHNRGVIHGMLKSAHILLRQQQKVEVAGFGLARILALQGIEESNAPNASMLNIGGTLLGAPEYSAPEWVMGQPLNPRSDMYALGILLFELLSGSPPFTGANPFEVALQHTRQPIPSICALRPDVPTAVELVLSQALARDPARRFSSPQELVTAFAYALKRGMQSFAVNTPPRTQAVNTSPMTSPAASIPPSGNIAHMIEIGDSASPLPMKQSTNFPVEAQRIGPQTSGLQVRPQMSPSPSLPNYAPSSKDVPAWPVSSVQPLHAYQASMPVQQGSMAAWPNSVPSAPTQVDRQQPLAWNTTSRRPTRVKRRKVIAALATVGVLAGAAGVFAVEGHAIGNLLHPGAPDKTDGHGMSNSPQKTTKTTPKPTQAANSGANMQKSVGSTSLAPNSAMTFTNPADGKQSLLVHLPNGTFVAYESACTHMGVRVTYDPGTNMLVCPAHGSIFDPAHGASVVQGPAMSPLPQVAIHVRSDGTITT